MNDRLTECASLARANEQVSKSPLRKIDPAGRREIFGVSREEIPETDLFSGHATGVAV